MNIVALLDHELCVRLAQTLTHFLWQGLLIAAGVLTISVFGRRLTASIRYGISFSALLLMLLCVPVTFVLDTGDNGVRSVHTSASPPRHPDVLATAPNASIPLARPLEGEASLSGLPMTPRQVFWPERSPTIVGAYVIGVFAMFLRLVVAISGGSRLRRVAFPIEDARLLTFLSASATQLGIRITPAIAQCERIAVPVIVGVIKPAILLPVSVLSELSPSQLEAILVHELAHLSRWDNVANLVQRTVESLLFFHPAVWYVSHVICSERENCCDDVVLGTGIEPAGYAGLLLRVAEMRQQPSSPSPAVLAVAGTRHSQLRQRVFRILGISGASPIRVQRLTGAFIFVLPILIMLSFLGLGVSSTRAHSGTDGAEHAATVALNEPKAPQPELSPKPSELTGRIVDRDGHPIEGATIDIWTDRRGNETQSDAKGQFRLAGLSPGRRVEILVTRQGYSPAYSPMQKVGTDEWVISLGDETYFEGVVSDSAGKPVPDAEVVGKFGPIQLERGVVSSVSLKAKTDALGRYRLYAKPDVYDLQVVVPGQGVAQHSNVLLRPGAGKPLDFRLAWGLRFEANVIDSISGKPVEGFALYTGKAPVVNAKSDSQGRLVIDNLPPGKFEFRCGGGKALKFRGKTFYRHGPFGRWWSPDADNKRQQKFIRNGWQRNFDGLWFDLSPNMEPVTIFVEQGVTLTGIVLDPDGNRVEGATVAPARTGTGHSITGDTRYSVRTQKDGSYRLVLPASGGAPYNLIAHDGKFREWRGWANGVTEPFVTIPGDVIQEKNIRLSRHATVRGIVLDLNGQPVPKHKVRLLHSDRRGNDYYTPEAVTDKKGQFVLKFARLGEQHVQAMYYWRNGPSEFKFGPRVGPAYSGRPEDGPSALFKFIDLQAGETLGGVELVVDLDPY